MPPFSKAPLKGRGAGSNRDSRFLQRARSGEHSQIEPEWEDPPALLKTEVTAETAQTLIAYNDSPDIPFDRSVNFARGCEHGCVYCYARPSHAYLGLSPGLDFETRIRVKANAAELLRRELARPGYRPAPLALGANTDPSQPFERRWGVTRQILEVLAETGHPALITTKGALVERDLDLLSALAAENLVRVMVSIATLDSELARRLEPRAAAPRRRLEILRALSGAGVPCGVMVAPVIPALTDPDIEKVLGAAREAGADTAGTVFLRLPLEVRDLFVEWLEAHYPQRAAHVMSLVRQARGGRDNDSAFGRRMAGEGAFADMIRQRFALACRRLGFRGQVPPLSLDCFRPPRPGPSQMDLFDPP
jgi:DNA repair photolyase